MYLTMIARSNITYLIICTKALVAKLAVYVKPVTLKMSEIGPTHYTLK